MVMVKIYSEGRSQQNLFCPITVKEDMLDGFQFSGASWAEGVTLNKPY
jgi:hypothetical protein